MKKLDDRLIFRCKTVWFELKVRPTIKKHQLTRVIFQFSVSASWCGRRRPSKLPSHFSRFVCGMQRDVHKKATLCNNRFRRFFCCFTWLDMWGGKKGQKRCFVTRIDDAAVLNRQTTICYAKIFNYVILITAMELVIVLFQTQICVTRSSRYNVIVHILLHTRDTLGSSVILTPPTTMESKKRNFP
jgi:hypothetical protein